MAASPKDLATGPRKHSMTISTFDDLLQAAQGQAAPQRLLFVFATAGLPDDASPEQQARHQAGQGGTLAPLMCVDKAPGDLATFDALCGEAQQFGSAWDIVFVAAMVAGSAAQAEAALQGMVESIKSGRISSYIPFNRQGQPVQFS